MPAWAGALRRTLLRCATVAYLLTLVLAFTGGGILTIGTLRVSARSLRNPLTILLITIAAAHALAPRGRRWSTLRNEWTADFAPIQERVVRLLSGRGRLAARVVVALLAAGVATVGLVAGAHVAGGADSYGYLSQARLWESGALRVEQPLLHDLPAGVPPETLVPLGYRLSPGRDALVPIYSPGLPLILALFDLVGGPGFASVVIPLLAGVAVWCTYLLGVRLAGPAAGVIAAALLSTSPAFIFLLTHAPMADIPTMAWWAVALVLASVPRRSAVLFSGLAAGAAILTRPNLAPLVISIAVLSLWLTWRRRASTIAVIHSLVIFSIGPIAAGLAVAWLNTLWYGGPATSGYGNLAGVLYRWVFLWPNLVHYVGWLLETEALPLLLAIAGAVMLSRRRLGETNVSERRSIRMMCGVFVLTVCLSYAFYLPLPEWWSLRLLFPAFPIMFAIAAIGVMALPVDTLRAAVVVMVAALGLASAREKDAFNSEPERRFATMGQYVADTLPPRAALLAMMHSGSARYYSGRLTLRWDMIGREQLDPLIADLQRRGYVPFILLDDWEETDFSNRFKGASRLAALDWEPVAMMAGVRLFSATPVDPRFTPPLAAGLRASPPR